METQGPVVLGFQPSARVFARPCVLSAKCPDGTPRAKTATVIDQAIGTTTTRHVWYSVVQCLEAERTAPTCPDSDVAWL